VLSLQHLDQLAEFRALQQAQHEKDKQEQARLQRRVKASAREERPAIWKEYFAIASNTNKIVSARSLDIEYAVAELEAVLRLIPGVDRSPAAGVGQCSQAFTVARWRPSTRNGTVVHVAAS
jgi:hypothetical protein